MDVATRIKQRRKELKITVDELAEQLGKNRATIYRYEKGEIENLPISILKPLAIALNTTPQYLMGWSKIKEIMTYEKISLKQTDQFTNEFDFDFFTEDEIEKISQYAKFLVSQRSSDKE